MTNFVAVGWIGSSIFFSTVLISINKYITRTFNFDYMSLLTSFHFFVTYFLLEIMCRLGLFNRVTEYPTITRWKLAAFGVGSVVFMNFNLARNSVGFYQLSKLCCIPAIVVYNFFVNKTKTPSNILISLTILLIGVGLYSVNDVELNLWGSLIATIAVSATAVFQISAGQHQKEYTMSGPQIQHATAFPQFVLCFINAIITEVMNPKHSILRDHIFSRKEISYIVLSAILAVGVNVSCFGIIGKTSALTYQVVGHVKTILILVSGFLLFPPTKSASKEQTMKTAVGMIVSMVGIIMYTSFGLRNKANEEEERAKAAPPALMKDATPTKGCEEAPLPGNLFSPDDINNEEKNDDLENIDIKENGKNVDEKNVDEKNGEAL